MGFRLPRFQYIAVLLVSLVGLTNAQIPSARAILETSEAEQTKFVNETMDSGFPDNRADQMTMLVINHSALVLPLIERRVEVELRSQSPSKGLIDTATEMIAYAGDEQALREVSTLVAIDDSRFGRLVGRTLDNALNFRNPFTIAYRGVEVENETIARKIGAWADSALTITRMQRLWAESILDRYGKVPGQTEWSQDPIVSRITDQDPSALRDRVTRLAADALAKRQQR